MRITSNPKVYDPSVFRLSIYLRMGTGVVEVGWENWGVVQALGPATTKNTDKI